MFRGNPTFDLPVDASSVFSSYGGRIRAAHELADLLKRTRPQLGEQVSNLQERITRCQSTLDKTKRDLQLSPAPREHQSHKLASAPMLSHETLGALEELELVTQALLNLRHNG